MIPLVVCRGCGRPAFEQIPVDYCGREKCLEKLVILCKDLATIIRQGEPTRFTPISVHQIHGPALVGRRRRRKYNDAWEKLPPNPTTADWYAHMEYCGEC